MVSKKKRMVEIVTLCPKCGKSGVRTEVNAETMEVLLICSNKACHSLLSKSWF